MNVVQADVATVSPALLAQLVRETVEGLVAPSVAEAVLAAALGPNRCALNPDWQALCVFIDRDLRRALYGYLDGSTAADVHGEVRARLEAVLGRLVAAQSGPSGVTTALVPLDDGPVPVVVLALEGRLVAGLQVALGEEFVAPYLAADVATAHRMVLIDGGDVLEDEHVDAVARAPQTLVLVWAACQPGGQRSVERARQHLERVVGLPFPGGSALLIDYVRASSGNATRPRV